MANVIYNPGMKDSFNDMAGILQMAGIGEQKRRQRLATERIIMAMASGDDAALNTALQEAVKSKADYDGGIRGLLQRIGASAMPGNPGMAAIQETAPVIQQNRTNAMNTERMGMAKAERSANVEESKARARYYEGSGRQTRSSTQELSDIEAARATRWSLLKKSGVADPGQDPVIKKYDAMIERSLGTEQPEQESGASPQQPIQPSGPVQYEPEPGATTIKVKAPDGRVWEIDPAEEADALANGYVRVP